MYVQQQESQQPQATNIQKPRIQFEEGQPPKRSKIARNQFMTDQDNTIEVFNPGASGLQVVEASVPVDQVNIIGGWIKGRKRLI